MSQQRLILSMDTGIDDALALAYLSACSRVDMLGVIGTYGNVTVETAVRNTTYVLGLLGRGDVPVLPGSHAPSWADLFIPDAGCAQFHGIDGLGGFGPGAVDVPEAHCAAVPRAAGDARPVVSVGGYTIDDPHANPAYPVNITDDALSGGDAPETEGPLPTGVRFIIDQVRRYGRDVTVVATGPLTDIDAALAAAPDIAPLLRLVMMGGTLTQEGNCWDLTAETNIIQDPEAADRVFHSGADITMVGLDVTHQCLLGGNATQDWRNTADLRESAGCRSAHGPDKTPLPRPNALRFLANIADFSIAANLQADARLFASGMPLHDPLAAAVAVDPTLVSCIDLPMKVETKSGDFHGTRGRTIGDPEGLIDPQAPRIHVALHVDAARFVSTFAARIGTLLS
ncbi:nucleoside hydrolase [Bifidobacterium sp. 64T4]|uniref:nucleoside hydrolase n=1 Tax=Bifidobacterium pongonis TaxID=2834432 RepID=UPI001C56561C|nr:nucleoside hydrolase [Bifidobacterium pongonis]MBW3095075.1 nucleoside hydrolase [Bifidobacterium pongonis]